MVVALQKLSKASRRLATAVQAPQGVGVRILTIIPGKGECSNNRMVRIIRFIILLLSNTSHNLDLTG